MMTKTALRNYCLEIMGITQWELRTPRVTQKDYLLLIETNKSLSPEENQLVDKMIAALGWAKSATQVEFLWLHETCKEMFYKKLSDWQPKKVLWYSVEGAKSLGWEDTQNPHPVLINQKTISIAVLPSLNELIAKPASKKQAWRVMQGLLDYT